MKKNLRLPFVSARMTPWRWLQYQWNGLRYRLRSKLHRPMIGPADVELFQKEIIGLAMVDPNTAHAKEDELRLLVLQAISQGLAEDPERCAALVVQMAALPFRRDCGTPRPPSVFINGAEEQRHPAPREW